MRTFWLVGMPFFILLTASCQPASQNGSPFEKGVSRGTNKNGKLEEASGIVSSAQNPGYLWSHNDSGNPPEIFLLEESTAKTKKVFLLSNVPNRDWEDIAAGPGPEENTNYLYVGDIGDNLARYPVKYIFRIREPLEDDPEDITEINTLIVKLDDGPRDTEALMCDPISKNLYLVSKREHQVALYEIVFPFLGDTLLAKNAGKLPFKNITAGDISIDGNEVLLKDYEHIYYWKRKGNESIPDLLKTPFTELAYDRELQGEGIAWAHDGSGFFTLGENAKGERAKLYFYKRK